LGRRRGAPGRPPYKASPEQDAIVPARRADPQGSLRVLAFAGTGKTTALRLLAEAEPAPGLWLRWTVVRVMAETAREHDPM
jgi:hypothetical protein